MPSSIVKLMTEPAEFGIEGRRFKRFYVCFGPLKEGFLHGCRPLIGLDGCHLKGPFGGILLTTVATDPNKGMYPIAWAQVEAENTSCLYWFLGLLKQDLMIENTGTYTVISDRQKVKPSLILIFTYLYYYYYLIVVMFTCRDLLMLLKIIFQNPSIDFV